jgi:hypothetical protein
MRAEKRPLPADDPRSLDHPSHKKQWMELARALGRLDAQRDFEAIRKGNTTDDKASTRKARAR